MPLPILLFPPLQSSIGCWNQTTQDVATSTIKHGDPWQSGTERRIEVLNPIIQKQRSLNLQEPTHNFYFGVRTTCTIRCLNCAQSRCNMQKQVTFVQSGTTYVGRRTVVTWLRLASMQSASFSLKLSLCSQYIYLTQWVRSGVLLRVHATRHQALNSISVFNPVNGRERKERESVREGKRGTALLPR